MQFEWDEYKNIGNFKKHKILFEEAQTVWADPLAIEVFDDEHSEKEERFLKIGHSTKERVLLVVFCEVENDSVRIISARKATTKEKKFYEERV